LVLADPSAVVHESVDQLAERAGVSTATIVRVSRRVGCRGFPALKIALARETGRSEPVGPVTRDPGGDLHRWVMEQDARSIREAAEIIDPAALGVAANMIAGAGEVLFCGVGSSAGFASLCALRMASLGVHAGSDADPVAQRLRAQSLGAGDVCVGISHSGESHETIEAVRLARRAKAHTIAVTSFANSPLTRAAALVLICTSQPGPARPRELFANPVALLSTLGALHAEVAARREPRRHD
jgi:DNA-binding MurR/RpiR family transcriptional regulator